jgi:glycosyltransferase involved in cell wall biosynthesis
VTPDSPDLSVVIPVFNGGRTIHRTLDSLLAAVRNVHWELLVMDDGSTDNTAKLVSRYAKKHPFIRLERNPKNLGTGATRNRSMTLATGRYLWFVDADDEVPANAFANIDPPLLDQGLDALIFDYEQRQDKTNLPMVDLDEIIFARLPTRDFSVADYPEVLVTSHFAWNKIFRREFLLQNDIRFLDATYHEDIIFHIKALCLASRIRKLPGALLRYYVSNISKGGEERLIAFRAFAEAEAFLRALPGINTSLLTAWQVFKANHLVGVYKCAAEVLLPEIRRYNDEFLKSLPLVELPAFLQNPFLRRDVMQHCLRLRGINHVGEKLLARAFPLLKLFDFFTHNERALS